MAFEHYDKCSLLLPMDGANNGTTFTDWSPNPKTITRNGDAKTVTAQSKYYGSSGYFDGNGDYLNVANTENFLNLTGTDFTISFWFRYAVTQNSKEIFIIGKPTINTGIDLAASIGIGSSGFIALAVYNSAGAVFVIPSLAVPTNGQWYHCAAIRNGAELAFYIDGARQGTATYSGTWNYDPTYIISIGRRDISLPSEFNGYLQDVAFFKGAALWTSNFTPPARLIGTLSGEVRDKDNTPASRIVTAFPRTVPTKLYQTTSSVVDGTFALRLPATESTALVMANEGVMRNDIVDRIIPE